MGVREAENHFLFGCQDVVGRFGYFVYVLCVFLLLLSHSVLFLRLRRLLLLLPASGFLPWQHS